MMHIALSLITVLIAGTFGYSTECLTRKRIVISKFSWLITNGSPNIPPAKLFCMVYGTCYSVWNYISEGSVSHINGVRPSFLENTAVSRIITFLRMLHT